MLKVGLLAVTFLFLCCGGLELKAAQNLDEEIVPSRVLRQFLASLAKEDKEESKEKRSEATDEELLKAKRIESSNDESKQEKKSDTIDDESKQEKNTEPLKEERKKKGTSRGSFFFFFFFFFFSG